MFIYTIINIPPENWRYVKIGLLKKIFEEEEFSVSVNKKDNIHMFLSCKQSSIAWRIIKLWTALNSVFSIKIGWEDFILVEEINHETAYFTFIKIKKLSHRIVEARSSGGNQPETNGLIKELSGLLQETGVEIPFLGKEINYLTT
ncbi:hypothetical protein ACFLY7_01020 [Patescibacteria group bacterium]